MSLRLQNTLKHQIRKQNRTLKGSFFGLYETPIRIHAQALNQCNIWLCEAIMNCFYKTILLNCVKVIIEIDSGTGVFNKSLSPVTMKIAFALRAKAKR